MTMERFGELIEVYVDGELTDLEAAELRRIIDSDPAAKAQMRQLLRDHALVRSAVRIGSEAMCLQRASLLVAAQRPTGRQRAAHRVIVRWRFERMRHWRWLSIAALLALSVGLAWWTVDHATAVSHARPTLVDRVGRVFESDAMVWTGDGRAALAWPDGSRIDLLSGTRMDLSAGVHLVQGRVVVSVMAQPKGEHFVISTPDASISVIGTSFRVHVNEFGTRIEVTDGRVMFTAVRSMKVSLVGPGQEALAVRRDDMGRFILKASSIAAVQRGVADEDGLWSSQMDRLMQRLPALLECPIVIPERWSVPNWHMPELRIRHEEIRREISTAVLTTWELALAGRICANAEARRRAAAWLVAWSRPGVAIVDDEDGDRQAREFIGRDGVVCFELPLLIQAADLLRGTADMDRTLEADLTRWFNATIGPAARILSAERASFNRPWGVLALVSLKAWNGDAAGIRADMQRLLSDLPTMLSAARVAREAGVGGELLGRYLAGVLIVSDIDRIQNGHTLAPPEVWRTACRTWMELQQDRHESLPVIVDGLMQSLRGKGPWRFVDAPSAAMPVGTTVSWLLLLGRADESLR